MDAEHVNVMEKGIHMKLKKDYCTLFPEYVFGTYIGDCCKLHDETCNPTIFYNCLKNKINKVLALAITAGGEVGCWLLYYKWRKNI
ncbi:MAG: hypothetical protein K0U20_09480 [Proteobacteria bacterium]|nr:hypothetical protein [Pseudomonadota bacterium]MCH9735757.1 hypothetical protein [Actinomycetes bacterium]